MRHFRFCLLAALLPFLGSMSFAGSVQTLDEVRQHRLISPFLGTYLTGNVEGGNDEINVVLNGNSLQLWYPCNNIPCSHFSIPLDAIGKSFQEQRRTSKGMAWVKTEYSITEGEDGFLAVMKETLTAQTWKSVETHSLRIKHSLLFEERTRHYFKPKYGVFGEWTQDLKSFNGKRNTLNIKGSMLKLSPRPIPLDRYIDMVTSLPSSYIVLTKPTTADDLRDVIENGDFEVAIDIPSPPKSQIPPKSADILDMSKYAKSTSCPGLLQDPPAKE